MPALSRTYNLSPDEWWAMQPALRDHYMNDLALIERVLQAGADGEG